MTSWGPLLCYQRHRQTAHLNIQLERPACSEFYSLVLGKLDDWTEVVDVVPQLLGALQTKNSKIVVGEAVKVALILREHEQICIESFYA